VHDQRLDEVGKQVAHVAGELRREIETLAQAMANRETNDHDQHHLTTFADRLSRLEHTVTDVSSTAERLGNELRHELTTLANAAETARLNGERESAHATRLVAELAARLDATERLRHDVEKLSQR